MSITRNLFTVARSIPEEGETGWGSEVTSILDDTVRGVDAGFLESAGNVIPRRQSASTVVTASMTLTPTKPIHRLSATSAVSLSTTTAIADGAQDGQLLTLVGSSDTNTITVPDAANTSLNGPAILGTQETLSLIWDSTLSHWLELSRST